MGGSARAASFSMPWGWLFVVGPVPGVSVSAYRATRGAPVASEVEEAAMRRALALAARGLGETSPNPSVGAVILDASGTPVGEGRTAPVGGPHAEVGAPAPAGERARGGTPVVTLEPCDPTGRTGPCTQALLAAGIARVVVAVRDPDARAAGGLDTLRAAGVDVESGVRAAEGAHLLRYWLTSVRRGRPRPVLEYDAAPDGRPPAPPRPTCRLDRP